MADKEKWQFITVRLPADLFEDVKEHASINQRSLNGEIIFRIRQRYLRACSKKD